MTMSEAEGAALPAAAFRGERRRAVSSSIAGCVRREFSHAASEAAPITAAAAMEKEAHPIFGTAELRTCGRWPLD